MTEKEREEEIFRRAERREELKKRFEISQKLRVQQEKLVRGADWSDAEIDSFQGGLSRNKDYQVKHAKKFSALNALKAKREEREEKDRIRLAKSSQEKRKKASDGSGSEAELQKLTAKSGKKNDKMLKASEIYSSSSSGGEEKRRKTSSSSSSSSSYHSSSSGESDTERLKSKKVVKKAQAIDTMSDLEKIRLSRFKMDKFVHLPCFKKTVIGCFVRIGIGTHPEKGSMYRVAEIVDVCETGKVYSVMKARTNVGLKLKHGNQSRVFRLSFVSNQPFTVEEFDKWLRTCKEEEVDLPTVQQVDIKKRP